jgi:hypothetical protein
MAAKSLAERLKLKNVSFEQMDAKQFLQTARGQFSVITATMVMHEFLEGPESREPLQWDEEYERLEDVRLSQIDNYAISTLKMVEQALTDTGYLITLNRSPTSATTWWFAQCLEEAGMKVSLARSSVIESSNASGVEKFPLIVARRNRENDERTTPEEILSLATFRELSTMSIILKEDMADLLLRSLGQQQIMFEAVGEYVDKSGVRTIQLLKTPTLLVLHDFTNHGFKTAFVAPLVGLSEVIAHCWKMVSDLEKNCTVTAALTEAGRAQLARLDYVGQLSPEGSGP